MELQEPFSQCVDGNFLFPVLVTHVERGIALRRRLALRVMMQGSVWASLRQRATWRAREVGGLVGVPGGSQEPWVLVLAQQCLGCDLGVLTSLVPFSPKSLGPGGVGPVVLEVPLALMLDELGDFVPHLEGHWRLGHNSPISFCCSVFLSLFIQPVVLGVPHSCL